jgi:hypothetical protein
MVRKSSIVAVVLGCVLILVGIVCDLATGQTLIDAGAPFPWALAFMLNICTLGAGCFWWPLVRRRSVPAHAVLRAAAYVVGIVCFLCIVVILGVEFAFGDAEAVGYFAAFYGLTLVVHIVALCYLLSRPRLLLTWVLGVLLTPLFCACVYMLLIPRHQWVSEVAVLYVALLAWYGPTAAPLLGLPFAWVWVKAAERKAATGLAVEQKQTTP